MKQATDQEIYENIEKTLNDVKELKESIYELETNLSIDFLNFNIERCNFEKLLEKLMDAYKPF